MRAACPLGLLLGSLGALTACGADDPATAAGVSGSFGALAARGADDPATAAGASALVAATTCGGGTGPVDSRAALPPLGGGCYPVGIDATGLALFPLIDPEWAPVVNGASVLSTPVQLQGVVIDSHVSNDDFPTTHATVDQNTDIALDAGETSCLATGNVTGPGNGPIPHVEMEWEVGSYPSWAWAGEGDRIVAWGRWIFDCGHPDPVPGTCHGTAQPCVLDGDCSGGTSCEGAIWNYRSELHPPQAVAVIRTGRGALLPVGGGAARPVPATRADVFVGGDGGGAGDACILTHRSSFAEALATPCFPLKEPVAFLPASAPALNGADFTFDVPLPDVPHAGRPVWQVVPRPDTVHPLWPAIPAPIEVVPVLEGVPHLRVSVRMTQAVAGGSPNSFAGTVIAGWARALNPAMAHLRVTIEGVTVRDALKAPLPFGLPVPDGWRVDAAVNGEWQELPTVPVASGGEGVYPVMAVFDQYLPEHGQLRVHAQGTSLTCQDVIRGLSMGEAVAAFPGPGDVPLQLALLCATIPEPDAGDVDASFLGPSFGASEAPYEIASGVGAYALRFRIERIDDGAEEAASVRAARLAAMR